MIVPLPDATPETSGGKAGTLGALLRAGLPVPDGFVVPVDVYRGLARELDLGSATGTAGSDAARHALEGRPLAADVLDALSHGLDRLGDPPVAVRSSATNEDTAAASAAGQYESVLGVRGLERVAAAVRTCWASVHTSRAVAYRAGHRHDRPDDEDGQPAMAVLVHRHVDADASGVMFTPTGPESTDDTESTTRIEATWGLGLGVVGGTVTPDTYRVTADGSVSRVVADKRTRLDRHGARLVTSDVPAPDRDRAALDDVTVARLARLGQEAVTVLGTAQDIEWAIADGLLWLLQARPVTAAPPPSAVLTVDPAVSTLTGTPGSHGIVTSTARIVRGPGDFGRVHVGDILVCPYTDPAWTPLLRVAAAVITETGGALSHAAIVAREYGVPAVLGVPGATTLIADGTSVTVDGTAGTVTTAPAGHCRTVP